MRTLVLHYVITCLAVYAAAHFVDGVRITGPWWVILVVGFLFALANGLVRPILVFFSFPAILLTLGLFYLVINAIVLWGTAALSSHLAVSGFVPALLGSIVISVVNWLLCAVLGINR
jgi:putative membrane protein